MRDQTTTKLQTQITEHRAQAILCVDGLGWSNQQSVLFDTLIQNTFEATATASRLDDLPAVIAVGGYGRMELAPFSDIDLILVARHEGEPKLDAFLKAFHRELFDELAALKTQLGYSFRILNDVAVLDSKTRTSLLDARLLCGDPNVFGEFIHSFLASFPIGEFLCQKIEERFRAFESTHDTPYVTEPDLKTGCGGLRCFNCANWIRKAIGAANLEPTEDFARVLTARNWLHSVAGKCVDRLSRQRQAEIADAANVNPFRFSSDLAASMGALNSAYRSALALLHESNFDVNGSVRATDGRAIVAPSANLAEAAFGVAQASRLGLRIPRARVGSSSIGPEMLELLAEGEPMLRALDECGLLGQILPEIEACRTLMPTDSVHVFTVFEHTLRAIGNMERLNSVPFLKGISDGINRKGALLLAMLLHDVGKAVPNTSHSDSGADIAQLVCKRWNLADRERELVVWLVQHHLALDHTIRLRDVQDPETAAQFAAFVETKERLDLLSILTYCDVNAVSPESWLPVQDGSLRELYIRTLDCLEAEHLSGPNSVDFRKMLARNLRHEIEASQLEAFLADLSAAYVTSTPAELAKLHFQYVQSAKSGKTTVEFNHRADLKATELTVCTLDKPGLLSLILGAVYAHDLNLHELRVNTTSGEPGVALDSLVISYAGAELPPATCGSLAKGLHDLIEGRQGVDAYLRSFGRDPDRRQDHFQHEFRPGSPAILEIRAPKGKGLGYRMSRWLAIHRFEVVTARFGQWAGRGAAAFYLKSDPKNPIRAEDFESLIQREV